MGLDSGLTERLGPLPYRTVRVLAVKQVDLLKTTSVGLDPVETTHPDYRRGNFYQLVNPRLILSGTLPHISKYETELDFSHIFPTILYSTI